jgi:hypothetical protein
VILVPRKSSEVPRSNFGIEVPKEREQVILLYFICIFATSDIHTVIVIVFEQSWLEFATLGFGGNELFNRNITRILSPPFGRLLSLGRITFHGY